MKEDFKAIQEYIEKLRTSHEEGKCNQCGAEIKWAEKQFKRNCPRCGLVLIRSAAMPKQVTKCYLCFDTGFVTYPLQIDGLPYTEGGACPECEAGQKVKNDRIPWVNESLLAPPIEAIRRYNKKLVGFKEA
jgi:predicted RNA-binding Zn-ribbon protein involved in translation (DUF1610 family)